MLVCLLLFYFVQLKNAEMLTFEGDSVWQANILSLYIKLFFTDTRFTVLTFTHMSVLLFVCSFYFNRQ